VCNIYAMTLTTAYAAEVESRTKFSGGEGFEPAHKRTTH
jgi:hypothetical protein